MDAAFEGSLELWHSPARMCTFLSLGRECRRFAENLVCFGMIALVAACAEQQPEPNTPASPPPLQSDADGAPPAPSETKLDTTHLGASVFVVNHVEDFDAFMKFFEEGAPERAKLGVEGQLLSRLDDGRVLVHFIAQDVDRVNAALKSKAMDTYLSREGAPGASIVWLAYNEVVTMPTTPPTGHTFSLLLKFPVADFTAFKRGFEARHAAFAEQSVIAEGLHQSAVDDTIAILHFVGTDRAKLEALPKRPEFGELLSIAGYHGTLEPMVAVDVARSRSAQSAGAPAPAPAAAEPAAPSSAP